MSRRLYTAGLEEHPNVVNSVFNDVLIHRLINISTTVFLMWNTLLVQDLHLTLDHSNRDAATL
jgi:hypothetical protein